MKIAIKVILLIVIALLITGYYFKNSNDPKGDAFIGIGILILSLILMPLFIYYRYRNGRLKSFIMKPEDDNTEN